MNQQNFEYLKDQVKYSGFGEGLEDQLKENLKKQAPEFSLQHRASFGKDEATTALNFKRSATTDRYFFNSYLVSLAKDGQDEKLSRVFHIDKTNNFTLKEAVNLLSGRAVNKDLTNKEGQVYNAWVQMDFRNTDQAGNYKLKQFHQNYGYDVVEALQKLPIKELSQEPDRQRMIDSLKKGNRHAVTFENEGNQVRRYIEAHPRFKTVRVYDENQNRVSQGKKQGKKQKEKQEQKQQQSEGEGEKPAQARRKRGLSVA